MYAVFTNGYQISGSLLYLNTAYAVQNVIAAHRPELETYIMEVGS